MTFLRLAAAGLALAAASPAAAWGPLGHQTVAEIAYRNVKPATRAKITRILKTADLLDTPACPVKTIEDASTWADCVRGQRDADGKQPWAFSAPWHYQDVEICQPYDPAPACKDGNCVSEQIKRDVALLRDKATSPHDRVQALVFLIHFVGDLHQPLHAGEKADKGGNDVKVTYGIYAALRLNLHSVWDSFIAERAITSGGSPVRRYTAAERRDLAAGSVDDWSRESWQAAHDVVYASALGGDPCGPSPAKAELSEATIASIVVHAATFCRSCAGSIRSSTSSGV